MKTNILFQRMLRALLMIVIMGSFTVIPNHSVSAKPVSATFAGCASQTQIPVAECNALVDLYNSANGASWPHNAGWLLTDTPCSWYGVSCTGTHVTNLSLSGNALSGAIPTGLSNLTNLTNLILSGNTLSGSIPTELGGLTQLTQLNLSGNALSGSIPTQLSNLTNLTNLILSNNALSGSIPDELGSLTNLMNLILNDNRLTGSIPKPLGNLVELKSLKLDNNQLTGSIPVRLGDLTKLEQLYLGGNLLTGEIPISLTNLTSLTTLTLSCGLTATTQAIIDFINGIPNLVWDVVCPPVNDDFAHALVITSLPHKNTQNTSHATTNVNDPSFSCGSKNQGTNSVWYTYTPASTQRLTLDTFGSNYDTMLAIWTGTRASLVNVGCNDDSGVVQSKLVLTVSAKQTYYIEVAGYSDSGTLVLNASIPTTPIPTPTRTRTPTAMAPITPTPTRQTFTSAGANDGWVLESGHTTSKGGTLDVTATTFNIGDDRFDKQYLGVLHFNTTLPNGAVITAATLKIKKSGLVGSDPFNTHGGLLVDVRKPFFGVDANLAIGDFQAAASKLAVATFGKTPVNGWYSATLSAAGISFIDPIGTTQFRLRFTNGDNNNQSPNYVVFFSGNAPAASRPQLIIQYYVP